MAGLHGSAGGSGVGLGAVPARGLPAVRVGTTALSVTP